MATAEVFFTIAVSRLCNGNRVFCSSGWDDDVCTRSAWIRLLRRIAITNLQVRCSALAVSAHMQLREHLAPQSAALVCARAFHRDAVSVARFRIRRVVPYGPEPKL